MRNNDDLTSVYHCLLADVSSMMKIPIIWGSETYDLKWAVNTAPQLEKHLLKAIETGHADLDVFPTWLRDAAYASLTDPLTLRLLRQVLLFAYKADIQCDHDKIRETYQKYFDTNSATRDWGLALASSSPPLFDRVRKHVQSVLFQIPWKEGLIPSHGPGSVFPKIRKGRWSQWFSTIESLYPYSDFMYLYYNRDHMEQMEELSQVDLISAKLIAVRKDSRGPRLICVHPSESIWIQKGLERLLVSGISRYRGSKGTWPCGHVHFDDQTVNANLAAYSSQSRYYATIDLKEASDRISDVLIQALFGRSYKYFGCCRAQKLVCPELDRSGIPYDDNIHAYAPMGNATTFPVQSIVFWAICVSTLEVLGGYNPSDIYVFGDDLVVPSDAVERIIFSLESFGLCVNKEKSFWRGAFRESCGTDAFHGVNVTPLRWVKRPVISTIEDVAAACNLAMRLRIAGYETAATELYKRVRDLGRRHRFSVGITNNIEHGSIAEFTWDYAAVRRRGFYHRSTQLACTRALKLSAPDIQSQNDWCHVLASLCALNRGAQQSSPLDALSRRISLQRGWIPIV